MKKRTTLLSFLLMAFLMLLPLAGGAQSITRNKKQQTTKTTTTKKVKQNNSSSEGKKKKTTSSKLSSNNTSSSATKSYKSFYIEHPGDRDAVIQQLIDDMVYVEGGTFTMGATREQGSNVDSDETPTHQVSLSGYYIGKYEVTQEQWVAVMGEKPEYLTGSPRHPVAYVSWDDCQIFVGRLSAITKKQFRLPTEAEWEYAARGGIHSKGYKYSGSNYVGDVAWFHDNCDHNPHPVGTKLPNELGLYDMSGNLTEWCFDWKGGYNSASKMNPSGPSSGSDRVCRGGSCLLYDNSARVSNRDSCVPISRNGFIGFRLAM